MVRSWLGLMPMEGQGQGVEALVGLCCWHTAVVPVLLVRALLVQGMLVLVMKMRLCRQKF
jgi:hypothetical protein